ncbi:Peroxidase, family 2-domain-containing protein [Aspergillus spinulosporus]
MKIAIPLMTVLGLSAANPHYGAGDISHWTGPGAGDYRGPCPMMNTLANHNFLPHDGRNITRDKLIRALGEALNFHPSLASLMFDMAIVVNPEPNATWFTLDQLNQHNVLEHDASLSRTDAFFGNNHIFNASIFAETTHYWTNTTLTPLMLANSKLARQITSRAFNPTYTFTNSTEQFSIGEVAAPIVAFGDLNDGTVEKELVEYFFRHERFPTHLGWKTRDQVVQLVDIMRLSGMIGGMTDLITSNGDAGAASPARMKRADLHAGFRG